ncbi:MAG: hypothetical protein BWX89_00043 [candidate division TA06 bacterium ADurb.Bin131]|uniref:Uncharacterized protein n=1 Tax=candidate division TA06 bacterium ADurb.Bin131 TaxID=1852827 RepID=A0A1V6CEN4_UNCT6|nr:MAG: hypothetical protein BWX89_00043 [candidate division TA06 bacterium ADurb.Bin131]
MKQITRQKLYLIMVTALIMMTFITGCSMRLQLGK